MFILFSIVILSACGVVGWSAFEAVESAVLS